MTDQPAPLTEQQLSAAPDPLAYGPTGYRCGCGKDAHSNLVPCQPDQPLPEALIGSITIRSESVQLDNGECLRDLAVGDSVELRRDTGHEGLWIAAAFHGDYQDEITLQYAEVVTDCGNDPLIACEFSGTRHAHPVDLDGKVRPRPAAPGAADSRPTEETHVVADDSDDPEHVDDCPGCEAFTLTGHRYAAASAVSGAADSRPA